MKGNATFGFARVIRGIDANGKWNYSPSIEYYYGEDWLQRFETISFENLSKLGRYSVLTDGDLKKWLRD
jgi:hypothetical protein